MARGNGSFFIGSLPVAKVHNVSMIQLGTGAGQVADTSALGFLATGLCRSRAILWFHEAFRIGGKPYIQEEVDFIKRMPGKVKVPVGD